MRIKGGTAPAPQEPVNSTLKERLLDMRMATLRDKVDLVGLFLIQKCASVDGGSAGAATLGGRLNLQAMGSFGKLLGNWFG